MAAGRSQVEVVFGWFLDGLTHPDTVGTGTAVFNSAVCGPARLLNLLETSLGTGGPTLSTAVRIAYYLTAIENMDDGQQFFSASFSVDPWSTARRLLQMRDQLVGAGWAGQVIQGSPRTAVFARIEECLLPIPGMADRLLRALTALRESNHSSIKKLTLATPKESLPQIWQSIVDALAHAGTEIEPLDSKQESTIGDLATVQSCLRTSRQPQVLTGDGSFSIIEAEDEIQAAEFLSCWLHSIEDKGKIVIIRGEDNAALDLALVRNGLPRVGGPTPSLHRAILQVMPLAFELAWTPFNPYRCLEFLSLTGGPIPSSIARPLKDAIKQQPGLDGPLWQAAWEEIVALRKMRLQEKYEGRLPDPQLDALVAQDVSAYRSWFDPISTNGETATSASIEALCRRIENWAMKRAAVEDTHSLYQVAGRHAVEFASIVNGFGDRKLNVHQLRKIINTVIASGGTDTDGGAQAAPWNLTDGPGQIWNQAHTVVWWAFSSSQQVGVKREFWSQAELDTLAENGVVLDSVQQQTTREAESWLNPLLNATAHIVLVKPKTMRGQLALPHPVWDQIRPVVNQNIDKITVRAADLIVTGSISLAGHTINASPLRLLQLPKPLRTWQVSSTINPREKESFTSIERLLGCPLSWALEYAAKIRPGSLESIAEHEQLSGSFAHAVIAKLISESNQWEIPAARKRCSEIIDELLPQIASTLLLPGNVVQLRKTKEMIIEAVDHLLTLLRDASLRILGCEIAKEAPFASGVFGGTIDLLVLTERGQEVVLDLKWSKHPHMYKSKLADGNALQLASYSWLVSSTQDTHEFAPVGFYLLRQARLFADSPIFGPNAVKTGRSMQATWQIAQEEYHKEMHTISSGTVVATGVPDTASTSDEAAQPFIEPPCRLCNYSHFCGVEELR